MVVVLRLVLILIFLVAVLLQILLRSIPLKELRRRARTQNDKKAAATYKLAVFGPSSELFLYLVAVLSVSPLILIASNYAWWMVFIVASAIIWLTWMERPPKFLGGRLFGFAAWVSSPVSWLVSLLHPVLQRPARWFIKPSKYTHGLYEKEDLQQLLKAQVRAPGNRISGDDLKLAFDALGFGDKTVASVMTPRRKIRWVAASEPIGPMLMDELHKTGQNRFPVVKEQTKSASPEVVGSLYSKDLLDNLESKGRIRDIMLPNANYINETQSLLDALNGFLESGRHLLVVVNNFEETVGVLTLDDLFEQIVGHKLTDDFDRYNDVRSVASQDAHPSDDKAAKK